MKIRSLKYIFNQGLVGVWRNKTMGLASIASVSATLTVLGLIIILVLNINNMAELAQVQFETIQVFLEDELPLKSISEIGERIDNIDGVKSTMYESKEAALEIMKDRWGDQAHLLEYLETNPLPNSYIIYLDSIEQAHEVVYELEEIHGISDIMYYKEIIDNLIRIASFITNVGLILIVTLIIISIFIIVNTIKITLNARKQEITIMKDIGATNWFIRWPLIIEGTILGLIGALIAVAVVHYGYQQFYNMILTRFTVMFSAYMITVPEMFGRIFVMFAIIGSGVGALGSILSLRRYLRV
ncbi:MAG: cell-division protein [Alkaliphilus sp.]|nr:ABC transporter permease [bacterium AH-315-G05]PHS35943.1 MAG: cell-division protein [Alkaliphilus sp.]